MDSSIVALSCISVKQQRYPFQVTVYPRSRKWANRQQLGCSPLHHHSQRFPVHNGIETYSIDRWKIQSVLGANCAHAITADVWTASCIRVSSTARRSHVLNSNTLTDCSATLAWDLVDCTLSDTELWTTLSSWSMLTKIQPNLKDWWCGYRTDAGWCTLSQVCY